MKKSSLTLLLSLVLIASTVHAEAPNPAPISDRMITIEIGFGGQTEGVIVTQQEGQPISVEILETGEHIEIIPLLLDDETSTVKLIVYDVQTNKSSAPAYKDTEKIVVSEKFAAFSESTHTELYFKVKNITACVYSGDGEKLGDASCVNGKCCLDCTYPGGVTART